MVMNVTRSFPDRRMWPVLLDRPKEQEQERDQFLLNGLVLWYDWTSSVILSPGYLDLILLLFVGCCGC